MSGIKDYGYSYTPSRRQMLREALQQWQQRRAAATEARLAENRRRTKERAAKAAALRASLQEFQQQRGTVTDARLAESRRLAQQNIESASAVRAAATEAALAERARETQQSVETLREAVANHSSPEVARPDVQETLAPISADAEIETAEGDAQLAERIAEIEAWRETLAGDEAVQTFQVSEVNSWRDHAESLLADYTAGGNVKDILARVDEIHREATRIHDEGGERQGKFEARNQLLSDIIASLKEIGFFVSDPAYEDANDPAGPVILRAVRGGEEMRASIDLSETVRSVWNGLEEEHCKSAFHQYVERMKERGVEITAKRPDLRERPILRQKGARDLPQSGAERAGG